MCEKQGIRLIQIFEDEWLNYKEIIKSKIKQVLNIYSVKVGKYVIKSISNREKDKFLKSYSLQSKDKSSIKLGAFCDNKLVSVITFFQEKDCVWKLLSFLFGLYS